jgi:hypothetical protein
MMPPGIRKTDPSARELAELASIGARSIPEALLAYQRELLVATSKHPVVDLREVATHRHDLGHRRRRRAHRREREARRRHGRFLRWLQPRHDAGVYRHRGHVGARLRG